MTEQQDQQIPDGMSEITVDVGERRLPTSFVGRWLVGPDPDESRTDMEFHDAGAYYGVAQTAGGRIAVYVAHCNDLWAPNLKVYECLEDAEFDKIPADILVLAARELGEDRSVKLDI